MNAETIKIRAKANLILWCTLFVCLIAAGLMWEYLRQTRPLDETVLVYRPAGEGNVTADTETVSATSGEIEKAVESESIKDEEPLAEPQPEFEALQEFLVYMLQSQELLDEDAQHVTVLDKIKQNPAPVEQSVPEESVPQVEENKEETKEEAKEGTPEDNSVENKTVAPENEKNVETTVEETAQNVSNELVTESEVVVVIPEIEPVVRDEEEVYPAENLLNFVSDEVRDTIDEIKNAAIEAENAMRENVQAEMQRVEEAGEETPIILIPGLQNM